MNLIADLYVVETLILKVFRKKSTFVDFFVHVVFKR